MLRKTIDYILWLMKWPLAVLLLVSTPALVWSYTFFNFYTYKFLMMALGVAFYVFILLTAGRNICYTMQILSHEMTHVFFALITLHSVGRVRLNPDDSGGSMVVRGGGNWLITLSPYFFPLFAFFYMLVMPWLLKTTDGHWLVYIIYGYFIAYYWATVLSQVHPKQTDIIKEGYIFSTIVIIAGNLYVTGLLFAFNGHLWPGLLKYTYKVYAANTVAVQQLFDFIKSYF